MESGGRSRMIGLLKCEVQRRTPELAFTKQRNAGKSRLKFIHSYGELGEDTLTFCELTHLYPFFGFSVHSLVLKSRVYYPSLFVVIISIKSQLFSKIYGNPSLFHEYRTVSIELWVDSQKGQLGSYYVDFSLIILNTGLDTEWLVYLAGRVAPAECVLHEYGPGPPALCTHTSQEPRVKHILPENHLPCVKVQMHEIIDPMFINS